MCGIFGFYGFEDNGLLKKMSDKINHRGPDDSGIFTDKNISLGNRRLKIIDLSENGKMPMCNENGDIWITYNGEIYNFQEIRQDLEKKGHKFKSKTDTEVVIHSYEEHGLDFVKKFRGMFAFALWDSKKKILILARDRIGIKPLYYWKENEKLVFASEIKALLEYEEVKRDMNLESLHHYLSLMSVPAPNTLFKNIYKLEPGTLLILKNDKLIKKIYWSLYDYKFKEINEDVAVRRTKEILETSVKYRMISDVPQGVFLSGGIDSSTIAAIMAKNSEDPINTLSISTGEGELYDESPFARIVAEKINSNHKEVFIGEKEFVNFLPEMMYYQDEPIGDPINAPIYYLSREARKNNIIVVQVGEGADELFCGYPPYKLELNLHKLLKPTKYVPNQLILPVAQLSRLYATFMGKDAHRLIKDHIVRYKKGDFPWHTLVGFTENEKEKLVRKKGHNTYKLLRDISNKVSSEDSPDLFMLKERVLELKNRIGELLLMRVDKFTMAASIEARVPFLDHKLVEFELGVKPVSTHMRNSLKTILKKSVKDLLPKEILERKKVGFGIPMKSHMNQLNEVLLDEVERGEIEKLLNTKYVEKLVKSHNSGLYGDTSIRTWILLNFILWHKMWILGEKIKI